MGYLIFLRLIHIVCSVIWTGGMIYYAVFVMPAAAKTLGPEGARFIQQLTGTKKFPIIIGALLALIGFVTGLSVNLPAARRMSSIAKITAASGSQPNIAQLEELRRLRSKSFAATNVIAILLFASLILMSIVKYY